ncbi:unnamed protein product [Discosporangium mesarthrocarpum]
MKGWGFPSPAAQQGMKRWGKGGRGVEEQVQLNSAIELCMSITRAWASFTFAAVGGRGGGGIVVWCKDCLLCAVVMLPRGASCLCIDLVCSAYFVKRAAGEGEETPWVPGYEGMGAQWLHPLSPLFPLFLPARITPALVPCLCLSRCKVGVLIPPRAWYLTYLTVVVSCCCSFCCWCCWCLCCLLRVPLPWARRSSNANLYDSCLPILQCCSHTPVSQVSQRPLL